MSSTTMPVSTQMDAVVIKASGEPAQSLALRSEPVPVPGPGEVLVEVHAAAVNPLDVVNAAGLLGTPLPMIPGGDYAGVVVSDGSAPASRCGAAGPRWEWRSGPSDRAPTRASSPSPRRGCHASLSRLTMSEAAAVGRSYFTAWQTVINIMELMPGETILITGGAGMVGQAATAIARWRGAEPIVADRRKPDGDERFIDTAAGTEACARRCSP